LYETESLKDEALYQDLHKRLQTLGKKTNNFIQSVEKEHRTDLIMLSVMISGELFIQHPVTSIQHRFASSNGLPFSSTRRFEAELR